MRRAIEGDVQMGRRKMRDVNWGNGEAASGMSDPGEKWQKCISAGSWTWVRESRGYIIGNTDVVCLECWKGKEDDGPTEKPLANPNTSELELLTSACVLSIVKEISSSHFLTFMTFLYYLMWCWQSLAEGISWLSFCAIVSEKEIFTHTSVGDEW